VGTILDNEYLSEIKSLKAQFIEIPALSDFPELVSGFTTRFGGLSKGSFACFNLNFNRPDPFVAENYKILSSSLNIPLKNMVLSSQVHGSNVLPVAIVTCFFPTGEAEGKQEQVRLL
jgi:copper oxidase (laccase) domain-containing protein